MISDDGSEDAAMGTLNDNITTEVLVDSYNGAVAHDADDTGANDDTRRESRSANEGSTTFENDSTELGSGEVPPQPPSQEVTSSADAELSSSVVPTDCQVDNDFVNVPPPEQGSSEMAAPMESDGIVSDGSAKSSSAASSKSSQAASHPAPNSPVSDDEVLMHDGDNTSATTQLQEKRAEQPKNSEPVEDLEYNNDQRGTACADSSDGEQSSVEYENEPDSAAPLAQKQAKAEGDKKPKTEGAVTNHKEPRERDPPPKHDRTRENRSSGKVQQEKRRNTTIRKSPRNHEGSKTPSSRGDSIRQKEEIHTKRNTKTANSRHSSSGSDHRSEDSNSSSAESSGSKRDGGGGRQRSSDSARRDEGAKRQKTLHGSKTVRRDDRSANRDSRRHSSGSSRRHSSVRDSSRRSDNRSQSKHSREERNYDDRRRGSRNISTASSSSEEYNEYDDNDNSGRKGRKRSYGSRSGISRATAASRRGKMYDRRSSRLRPPSSPTVINKRGVSDGRRKLRSDRDVTPKSPVNNRSHGGERTPSGTSMWKTAKIRANDERRSKPDAHKRDKNMEGDGSDKSSTESGSSTKSGSSEEESSEEPPIFEDAVVHFASGRTIQDNKPVSDALLKHGGTILLRLTPRVNFLVAVNSDKKDCRVKLRRALQQKNTFIVRPRLFLAALEEGNLTDELIQKYALAVDLDDMTSDDERPSARGTPPRRESSSSTPKKSTPNKSTPSKKKGNTKKLSPSDKRGLKNEATEVTDSSDVEMDDAAVVSRTGPTTRSNKERQSKHETADHKPKKDDAKADPGKPKSASDMTRYADQFKTLDFTSEDCVFKTLLVPPKNNSKESLRERLMEVVELPENPEQAFAVRITKGDDILNQRKDGGRRVQKEIISESANIKGVLKCFKEKFQDLTGNEWMRSQANTAIFFVENPDKFTLSPIWNEPPPNPEEAETAEKLGPVRDVIARVCDPRLLVMEMENMGIEVSRLSLERLCPPLVESAVALLADVGMELIKNNGTPSDKSASLAEKFFHILCYRALSGAKSSRTIPNISSYSNYVENVLSLRHITLCRDLIKSVEAAVARHMANARPTEHKRDFISYCFKRIGAELLHVMPKDPVYSIVQTYLLNTSAASSNLSLRSLFEVVRPEEDLIFDDHQGNSQRKLLWYGSRTSSFASLLLQGVTEPIGPAPLNHLTFGKGVCFYDVVSEALEDCHVKPGASSAWLLLCEVALGEQHKVEERPPLGRPFALAKGCMSAVAMGRVQPDPTGTVNLEDDDITVPSGKLIPHVPSSPFSSNQYAVFDDAQICTRFLVELGLDNVTS